mgnify:CR=1 FL=1
MPNKLKIHKGIRKRMRVTATGKILRKRPGKGHLMTTKNSKRRRRLSATVQVAKPEMYHIRKLLGLG